MENKRFAVIALLLTVNLLAVVYGITVTQTALENQVLLARAIDDRGDTIIRTLDIHGAWMDQQSEDILALMKAADGQTEAIQLLTDANLAVAQEIKVYQDYIFYLSGQLLETPETQAKFDVHLRAEIHRDGELIDSWEHPGLLTTTGLNWIEDQLGDSPSTTPAINLRVSTSTQTPQAAWTGLPGEITAYGLAKADGTYTSTGDGEWEVSHQWTATAEVSANLAGVHWDGSAGNGTLLCSDQMLLAALQANDTLTLTYTLTVVSGS